MPSTHTVDRVSSFLNQQSDIARSYICPTSQTDDSARAYSYEASSSMA